MKLISFDIETGPFEDASKYDGIMPEFTGNTNTKDPVKIAEQIEAKKQKWMEDVTLSPLTSRVEAIGFCFSDNKDNPEVYIGIAEEYLLLQFWSNYRLYQSKYKFIGHYSNQFDLPFIIHRTRILGLTSEMPYCLRVMGADTRPFFSSFIDLIDVFKVFPYSKESVKLDDYSKGYGVGKKTMTGDMFWKLSRSGDKDLINKACEYLIGDVVFPMEIALKTWDHDGKGNFVDQVRINKGE